MGFWGFGVLGSGSLRPGRDDPERIRAGHNRQTGAARRGNGQPLAPHGNDRGPRFGFRDPEQVRNTPLRNRRRRESRREYPL